jgi:hypothetical protein
MHSHRLALALASSLLACQTGIAATGSTGETGDDTAGTTTSDALGCGDANNSIIVDGSCYCEPGTTWIDPFDPTSFECAALEPREGECDPVNGAGSTDNCTCDPYYRWCSDEPTSTACCYDPAQDPENMFGDTSTGDTSTGDTSTGDTSTGSTDATSTGTDTTTGGSDSTSTGETSSTGDASTDSTGSSSGSSSSTM